MLVWRGLTPLEDLTGALLFFFSNPHSEWAQWGENPQFNTHERVYCERQALLQ